MWQEQPVDDFRIDDFFPRLRDTGYEQASPVDFNQNCFGYVLHRHEWWEAGEGNCWPRGIADDSVTGWMRVLEQHGFATAANGSLQSGVEKIALYARDDEPQHVARQASDGTWESKLGWGWDIKHKTPDCLEGDAYGTVTVFMQRERHD